LDGLDHLLSDVGVDCDGAEDGVDGFVWRSLSVGLVESLPFLDYVQGEPGFVHLQGLGPADFEERLAKGMYLAFLDLPGQDLRVRIVVHNHLDQLLQRVLLHHLPLRPHVGLQQNV
jgi:hypothetical protein